MAATASSFVPRKPALRPKSAASGARQVSTSQRRMEQIQAAFSNQIGTSTGASHASLRTAAKARDSMLSGLGPEDSEAEPSAQPLADKQDDVRSASASLPSNPTSARAFDSLLTKMPVALLRPGSRLAKRSVSAAPVSVFADHSDVAREAKEARGGWDSTRQAGSTPSSGLLKRPLPSTAATGRNPNRQMMPSYHCNTFVYAVPRHCLESGRAYNPYDIVTVSHELLFGAASGSNAIAGTSRGHSAQCDYYTISGAGFTFHQQCDGFRASFLSTNDWERQKRQFERITRLPTFQLFRYRKVFMSWKNWIRREKIETARVNLLSELYFSHPPLVDGMRRVQAELAKLAMLQLVCDFEGRTLSVPEFSDKNAAHLARQVAAIRAINSSIQDILLSVCQSSLDSMESAYGGVPGHEFALSTRKSSNFQLFDGYVEREIALATADAQLVQHEHFQMKAAPARLSPTKAAQLKSVRRRQLERTKLRLRTEDPMDNIRWTMAAIRRRKCVQLTKFVFLVDFMQLDGYVDVVVRSVETVYNHLLRGPNAGCVRRLLAHDDLVLAFHNTLDPALRLSKQEARRFLRLAMSDKFQAHAARAGSDDAKSAAVWMESMFETLFSAALAKRLDAMHADTATLDDLVQVLEVDISRGLILPSFSGQGHCIFQAKPPPSASDMEDAVVALECDAVSESAAQAVPALVPVPLVRVVLQLASVDAQHDEYALRLHPNLDDIAAVIKSVLSGFVELFEGVSPLTAHPDLASILQFSGDIRCSILEMAGDGATGRAAAGSASGLLQRSSSGNNSVRRDNDRDDESHPRSNAERLVERLNDAADYNLLLNLIDELMANTSDAATHFVSCYADVLAAHSRHERFDFDSIAARFRRDEYSLAAMTKDVVDLNSQIRAVESLSASQHVEFLVVDVRELQAALLPAPLCCVERLKELFPTLAHERCDRFRGFAADACARIQRPVTYDLEAFASYLLNLKDVIDKAEQHEVDLSALASLFHALEQLGFVVPPSTTELFSLCEPEFLALKAQIVDAVGRRETDINEYSVLLSDTMKQLGDGIEALQTTASDPAVSAAGSPCHTAKDIAHALEAESTALATRASRLVWVQDVLAASSNNARPPTNDFAELGAITTELTLKRELWDAVCAAEDYLSARANATLREIDIGELKAMVEVMNQVVRRLQQSATRIAALTRLVDAKDVVEGLTPVIRDLRNEHLEERHWAKLERKLQCSFTLVVAAEASTRAQGGSAPTPVIEREDPNLAPREVKYLDLPLRHLLEIQAVTHATAIHQVSEEASAEAAISTAFESVLHTWDVKEIPTTPRKDREGRDAHCLDDCAELVALLEESEVLLRVMDFSSYARTIQTRLTRLLSDFALAKSALELLQICQQKWEQVQRLASADFLRSFPDQAKILQRYDAAWRALMEALAKRPLCIPFGVGGDNRHTLQVIIEGFETVAKSLSDYLEVKRQVFPPFFRLSNYELSVLLSRARDVGNIQPFLHQCFENIGHIEFGTRDAFQDIQNVVSRAFARAEVVPMGKNLKARGPPEQWLAAVDKRLAEQLRRRTKDVVAMLADIATTANAPKASAGASRPIDLLPIQSVLLADRIQRCELVDAKMRGAEHATHEELRRQLSAYHRLVMGWLFDRSDSGNDSARALSPRDLILRSCAERSSGGSHDNARRFGIPWELALKYRFDDSTTVGYECHVEMNGLSVPYGFHYMSPHADSVVTPGSLRTLFAVFGSVRSAQGIVLTGPTGTGKTHLAFQVSRILGRQCFTTTTAVPTMVAHNIEHSVLTKLSICGLQREPIAFIPGTALFLGRQRDATPTRWNTRFSASVEHLSRFEILECEREYIIEALLLSKRFESPRAVASKLATVWYLFLKSTEELERESLQLFLLREEILQYLTAELLWVVFDGDMESAWLEYLSCVLTRTRLKATENLHEPIHRSYIRRYLSMGRAEWQAESQSKELAMLTFKLVERRLLHSKLLDSIFTIIQGYGCTVQLTFLQRVVNLLSLLQALLSSVAAAMSREVSGGSRGLSNASDVDKSTKTRLEYRVEIALVYALMWGFAGCVNDNAPVQMLINGMLKTQFEAIAASWQGCGKDCKLFETVIDIAGARFVSVHHCTATLSASLSARRLDTLLTDSSTAPESFSNSSLFVPTHTSVLAHAAMKEALRSGRGVLLVGDDNSRRTKLLRNFLLQADCLKAAVQGWKDSKSSDAKTLPDAASVAAPSSAVNDMTLESVERIRFHQISLVTALAAKFRRLHHAPAHTADSELAAKLDSGDFVPFFFTMNQYTRGVADIAQCVCSVASSYILDTETLLRLWSHESLRSLGDPFELTHPQYHQTITKQIWRARRIMEAMGLRFDGSQLDATGAVTRTGAVIKAAALEQQRASDGASTNHFNTGYNAVGFLAFFSTELQDKKESAITAGGSNLAGPRSSELRGSSRQLQQQCNSFSFVPRRSASSSAKAWVYVEIFAEDAPEQEAHATAQHFFGAPGSGRDILLRYVCATKGSTQHQTVLMLEGVPDSPPEHTTLKWRLLVRELFERVGVGCDNVTLIVKRLDLLPECVLRPLLILLSSGEAPGAFALEDQIKMATRVRDERLVEIDNRLAAHHARFRREAELERGQELAAIKRQEKEALSINSATFYHEFEQRHQQALALRLAQLQLRHQQDCDDYTRTCEVETESVTATIMSLMRPLGITSGKWQKVVGRIRQRLRVVFFVDLAQQPWVKRHLPTLLPQCSVVSCPVLSESDLHTALYGHFHTEVQRLVRVDRFAASTPEAQREREAFVAAMEIVEHELPRLTKLAVDIHLAAVRHHHHRQQQQSAQPGVKTWLAMSLPSFFARFLEHAYKKERERLVRAEWFAYVHDSLSVELDALRNGDSELRARVLASEQQVAEYEAVIEQQTQNCARIRDMMGRFQDAAEQQVTITNETEQQAQVELHVPLACLEEANAALLLIEKRHIVEIKSFNNPPLLVHLVLDAVCVLFGAEPTWENARRILSDANVVQHMLSFDKDNVPDETLAKLASPYISDARFNREEVEKQSLAASMMVIWVRAIYQYASTRRVVKPTLDKLEKAQGRLRLLMQEFQVSRQRAVEADDELAKSRASLATALELKDTIVAEIESRETRVAAGLLALQALADEKQRAEKLVEDASRARTSGLLWWNALLTAAFVVYGGGLCQVDRVQLFDVWEAAYWRTVGSGSQCSDTRCRRLPALHVALRVQETVEANSDEREDIVELLCRTEPDRADWQLVSGGSGCFSTRRLQDALFLSKVDAAGFPVVLITDYGRAVEELVLKCARNLWRWSDFFMVSARAGDLDDALWSAVRDGTQLLVLDVEPADGETGFGSLASVFQWETCLVGGEEHLVVSIPHASSLASTESSTTSVGSGSQTIPIHSAFRVVLASHCAASAFGDAIARIPTLSGAIAASEIADIILDKLWSPGVPLPGTEPLRLKLALREFAALTTHAGEQQTQLTKLAQEAAVHGDFQVAETTLLQERANALRDLRAAIESKRQEIVQEARRARELAPLSAFGAAIFNSFNATRAVGSTTQVLGAASATPLISKSSSPPPQLSLQLFLPVLFSALSSQAALVSTPPASSSLEPHAHDGRRASISLQANPFPDERRRSVRLRLLQKSFASLESHVPEALQEVLTLLMPMTRSRSEWYAFLLQLLWTLEENRHPQSRGAGADPSERDVTHWGVGEQPYALAAVAMELRRWNVSCSPQEAAEATTALEALNAAQLARLIVDGALDEGGSGEPLQPLVQRMFAASRPRSERMEIGLALLPSLAEHLCDHLLSAYGVSLPFAREDDEVVSLAPQRKLGGSPSALAGSGGTESAFKMTRVDSYRKPASDKHGWLRQVTACPEDAGILVVSTQPLQSFAFVQRAFFQTIFTKEVRVAILQQLAARSFRSASELGSVFFMPKTVFLSNAAQQQALLASGADSHANPVLWIRAFEEIRRLETEKPDVLEAASLAIVNMQRDKNPVHWEGLFSILHRSYQHTTSVALRRHADPVDHDYLLKVKSSPPAPSTRAQSSNRVLDTTVERALTSGGTSPSTSNTASSVRVPKMRRLSTTQSIPHRHSDLSLVALAYPKLLAVVDSWDGLPVHLRQNLLCLFDGASSERSSGATSLRKCVETTLLRLAFHPCREQLHAALAMDAADPKPKAKGSDAASGSDKDTSRVVEPQAPAILQVLSSLVLFHSIAAYRGDRMVELTGGSSPAPSASVGYDQFVSAVNQLLLLPACLKPTKQLSGPALFERLQQQVVLGAYVRTAASPRDAESSNLRNAVRKLSLSFAVGGNALFSDDAARSAGSSPRAPSTSALAFLNFPIEAFPGAQSTASIADMDPWFTAWWDFADSLDVHHHAKLCKLFAGSSRPPDAGSRSSQTSLVGSVDLCIPRAMDTSVAESFAWAKTPLQNDSELAASISLAEAVALIDVLLSPESLPVRFDRTTNVSEDTNANDEGETLAQPPEQLRTLVGRIQTAFLDAFNREVEQIRTFLTELQLEITRSTVVATSAPSSAAIGSEADDEAESATGTLLQETAFAVFAGIRVVGAAWNAARGCLEPQPLESGASAENSTSRPGNTLRGSGSEPIRTLACPLLRLRDSAPLFAFALPAAAGLLGSLLSPFLSPEGSRCGLRSAFGVAAAALPDAGDEEAEAEAAEAAEEEEEEGCVLAASVCTRSALFCALASAE
ncbi:hypothetical protein PybrP1_004004 [[Pythium] brassicae (nom. inval.)]|nr:hypothetical protein PybrP1_004004 [[Pythium] brassicae (nom. inval.)]